MKLIALQFDKPYVKSNKNDAADAEAICEAVRRPNMRFVPIKSTEQQAVLAQRRGELQTGPDSGDRAGYGQRIGALIGDAKNFGNGRQVAAWLGLVPRQHPSGGKQNLLRISKRGDTYLRTLLIHGARSVIYRAAQKPDQNS